MPRRVRYQRWRLPTGRSVWAVLALVVACSGSGAPDFFTGPPLQHAGSGGSGGKPVGSGGSGDGAGAGDDGGAPDGTGGTVPGGAGEPATGGTGGTSGTGGSIGTGGTAAVAGGGGTDSTGGIGGIGGIGGDAASGGQGTGGGTGGIGGAGMGGTEPTAGTTGVGGGGGPAAGTAGAAGLGGMVGVGGKSGCEPTEIAKEICDGIDNDCEGGIDDGEVCPDGCVGAVYDKHLYLLCHGPGETTYARSEAHSLCNDFGDELDVTLDFGRVESEEENEFLVEFLSANPDTHAIWMAASDSPNVGSPGEGSWVWGPEGKELLFYEDDEVVDGLFEYWASGEPDDGGAVSTEDCGVFDPARDYHWDDRSCSNETEMFLCEQLDD